ncbi:filamentous hemagglutinin N-terminal domain-containing protein [Halopseudomonas laoshanensis]|uniref:Filamentous hemagglutinin N-terminal domain-containing protein n=1 Tax=Halopseudomonas laoshanensis TaxID=2268758 RepID=A0A7V7GWG9_9GAMM|nr:filamentous hemagglutinin N-terminal domain-containing protein [Halopseudomonas laoshanensis]KAA0696663.1 filamentous hemagglutinin N-terminal domain-containing protein [Halopseudomonas laoshanensis]
MNNIYQSIWNAKSGTYIAASEHAKVGGKRSAGAVKGGISRAVGFALQSLAAAVMLATGFSAHALPVDGSVAAGAASIANGEGSMTVNQASQNVSINWQSFNIGQGESVTFVQPNSSAVALNRVLGSDPSSILGSLDANGQVFLINPNGVLFGQSASVNVGGLVASTLNLSDSDFMAGDYNFAGASDGSVVNQGAINADGGYVALLGANVSNQGVIQANLGTVALAAGDAITLDVAGDGLLNVAVDQGSVAALVQNGGMIQADGGKVLMTARSAGNLFQSAVNNTGVVRAQSIHNRNGTITLLGDMHSGTVDLGGELDVSGDGAGQTGGSVVATANQVGLVKANIDASGDAGGGTVLLGGGYQGKDAAVQNAKATHMSADSSITADALSSGDGGTVVLWGNESTRAYGSITARGGAESGNGGMIETSGGWLDVSGIRVNTSAPNGQFGMWLLDPADITISSAPASGATSTGNVFAPDSGMNVANINVNDLVMALGGSNITVTTENTGASGSGNGDITVMNAVTWVAPTTLTLNADRDVNVNLGADITGTLGSLEANAGRDINVNADITTTTGGLSFIAVNDVTVNAATTITTGNLTAVAGQNVNLNAAMTVTTGDVILRADNDGTGPGAILGGTVLITCGSNCITIGTGDLSIRFNPVNYAQTNAEILAYGLNLTGGGALDAKAWVFGLGDNKVYDGLRDATVSGLETDITNTPPPVALGAVTNALFDTKDVGVEKLITYESTFADPVFDLFSPFGTAVGTYVTRADITPAPLTITANNATKVFGETLVLGTSAFTSVGLVAGETIGGVTLTSPGAVGTATVDGNPYAITPSDAVPGTFDQNNYAINYVDGTLLISQVVPDPVIPVDPVDPVIPVDPVDPVDPPGSTPPGSTPPGSTPDPTEPDLPTETLPGVTNPNTSSPYDDSTGRQFVAGSTHRAAGVNYATEGTGINLEVAQLTQLSADPVAIVEEEPRAIYVPPVYAPRQDRN